MRKGCVRGANRDGGGFGERLVLCLGINDLEMPQQLVHIYFDVHSSKVRCRLKGVLLFFLFLSLVVTSANPIWECGFP